MTPQGQAVARYRAEQGIDRYELTDWMCDEIAEQVLGTLVKVVGPRGETLYVAPEGAP